VSNRENGTIEDSQYRGDAPDFGDVGEACMGARGGLEVIRMN
jgi:hypothetical protein